MVNITLPNPNDFQYEGGIKHFLRQLELCVHHAQKSYDEIVKDRSDEVNLENIFCVFRFPKINLYGRKEDRKGFVKVHVDEEGDQMQNIILEINEL